MAHERPDRVKGSCATGGMKSWREIRRVSTLVALRFLSCSGLQGGRLDQCVNEWAGFDEFGLKPSRSLLQDEQGFVVTNTLA